VSWSLADCIVGDACEIGIHTAEDYRRQGLATLTAAATVDGCLARGLTAIGWHCDVDNLGSRGVAERVGFRHERDYVEYVCFAAERPND
jgi:RimJ/RimL family protein N-acetyltransferase